MRPQDLFVAGERQGESGAAIGQSKSLKVLLDGDETVRILGVSARFMPLEQWIECQKCHGDSRRAEVSDRCRGFRATRKLTGPRRCIYSEWVTNQGGRTLWPLPSRDFAERRT